MTTNNLFDRPTLERLLNRFLTDLNSEGVEGTVFLVGGAALSLYYFNRDATLDIDTGFPEDPRVQKVIANIAKSEGLNENWINSNAVLFFGFPPMDYWEVKNKVGKITLRVASAKLLLAMKLNASRGRRDSEDIRELLEITKIESFKDVETIFEEVYAQEVLKSDARELVLAFLEEKGPRY